ncbi:hypothetical protein G6F56_004742 [Rhizopus delemar]|nr:hypothetical protein G6F56_004742 [Rhizopus delemar]
MNPNDYMFTEHDDFWDDFLVQNNPIESKRLRRTTKAHAHRQAQNRAAQRAFRERQKSHLQDLQDTIDQLREQRDHLATQLKQAQSQVTAQRVENWYLKGIVLTLQFVCSHYQVPIPAHAPYLTERALEEMAETQMAGIDAYVKTYTKNDVDLRPTMAAHFAHSDSFLAGASLVSDETKSTFSTDSLPSPPILTQKDLPAYQSTLLQLAVPHDPRIDLVPNSETRDRMILFRDILDFERCYSVLSDNGEIPKEFLGEFWYLVTDMHWNHMFSKDGLLPDGFDLDTWI